MNHGGSNQRGWGWGLRSRLGGCLHPEKGVRGGDGEAKGILEGGSHREMMGVRKQEAMFLTYLANYPKK